HRFRSGARDLVPDDASGRPCLLPRRLHVRRRRLRVLVERLADGLPVDELAVEAPRAQLGDEAADELRDRLVVEHATEELALEPARHLAPVAAHRLEADAPERPARGLAHEARIALLAARPAAADLRHPEAPGHPRE